MKIQEIRKAKKIKQADLAKKIGISNSLLSRYENGDMTPSKERLKAIAEALEVDVEELASDYSPQLNIDDIIYGEDLGKGLILEAHESSAHDTYGRLSQYNKAFVRQQVMMYAEGKCELCGTPAPFKDKAGNPYLETHLLVPFKDGGEMCPSNIVALCPNCNRRLAVAPTDKDNESLSEIASHHTWKNYLDLVELIKSKES